MTLEKILEEIALPARSNKRGFYNVEKLNAIAELLEKEYSPYHLIKCTPNTWIFAQREITENEKVMIISTHADIVDEQKKPNSKYIEDEKYFKGTYDNLGTNGVCVSLMINRDMPDNVIFAFNAEEESGRCLGATDVLEFVRTVTKVEPDIIALDVTDEGYENDRLFTIEGCHGQTEEKRVEILNKAMNTEGNEQSFEVVRLKKKHDNSFLPDSYRAKGTTIFDESCHYAKNNCNSFSMCLPGDGEMHDDSGFFVKGPVMLGYEASLTALIYEFTNTYPERLSELKSDKDEYIRLAKEIDFHKFKRPSYTYSGYSTSSYSNYLNASYNYGRSSGYGYVNRNDGTERFDDDDEYYQYNLSDYDSEYKNYSPEWEAEMEWRLEQLENEVYDWIEAYSPEDFDIFAQDITTNYGLPLDEKMEEELHYFFDSYWEALDDENNYDDYDWYGDM